MTGEKAPNAPLTAREYDQYGLPWFEYYDDKATARDASDKLRQIKSVIQLASEKGEVPLPENKSVAAARIEKLRRGDRKGEARNGRF